MERYVGLDIHKKNCPGVIMDEDEEFENSLLGVERFFQGYQDAQVVIEASYSWRPTYERLEEMDLEVKLAHPHKVRAIAEAKIKTDSIDARTLAHLLRADLIPESYVPPEEIRELRDKVRLRAKLGRERSRMKCKIRAELEKNRITTKKNPFTKSGKKKLRELGIGVVDHYLAVLDAIEERIEILEKDFEEIAEDDEEAKLLMTIPGISHFSALLILSEIEDINRFPNPEKLCSYAGVVPTIHQSGETMRMGSVKKESSGFLR